MLWRIKTVPASLGGYIRVYRIIQNFGSPDVIDPNSWEVSITQGDAEDWQPIASNYNGVTKNGLSDNTGYYVRIRPAGGSGLGQYHIFNINDNLMPLGKIAIIDWDEGLGLVGASGSGLHSESQTPDYATKVYPYQYRCVQSNGQNTGEQEAVFWDRRPDSPTYLNTQWMSVGENLEACPLPPPPDPVNTGYKAWTTLQEYYTDDNTPTGVTKPNTPGDPHYIAPLSDPAFCPIGQP